MPDIPKLYGYGASTYTRMARLAFVEKGVEYDFVPVASWDGYHKAPAFNDLHPFKKVPVLDHAGTRLFETLAICTYVDARFDGPGLHPDDPVERAKTMQLLSTIVNYAWPVWVPVLTTERFFCQFEDGAPDSARIAQSLPQARYAARVIDGLLAAQMSSRFDIADIFLAGSFCYLAEGPDGEALLNDNRALSRWWDRACQRASVRDIMPRTDWSLRLSQRNQFEQQIS